MAVSCLVAGCAQIEKARVSDASPMIDAVEQVGATAIESRFANEARRVQGVIRQAVEAGTPPTAEEARQGYDSASAAYARLRLGRLAYDAVLAATAAPATLEHIQLLRLASDDAYAELLADLQPFLAEPPGAAPAAQDI